MNKRRSSVAFAFGLLLSGLVSAYPAVAQDAGAVIQSAYSGRVGFTPPLEDGAPERTRGGATRGRCQATSLMPRSGSGLTSQERASIYVHVAKHPEAALNKAILTLKEDTDEGEQYDAIIEIPEAALSSSGGVLEVVFPESIPALEVEKQYSWSLIMICDDLPVRPDSPVVGGGIKRVAPASDVTLSADMSSLDRATAYGDAGLWYDLLETLASTSPGASDYSQLNGAWKEVLTKVGISEEISNSTFIN